MTPTATPAPRAHPSRLLTVLDLLLLAGLCLLFFWRVLPLAGIDYRGFAEGDFSNQFYAFASYRAARLAEGALPLWSPYALSGHPFVADIQSAVFYPIARLTVAFSRAGGFSYAALQLEAVAHFPIAAAGMYLLARRLTNSRLGAWVGALAFTFSAYFTGYPVLQLAILETVVWLPWIFLALDHAATHLRQGPARRALAPMLLAGLLFGVALLAGHPQSALLVGYAALAFAMFRGLQAARSRSRRGYVGALAAMLAFLPLGAAVAAIQLLPSLEYMRLSTRAGIGIDAAGRGLTPYDLIQFLLPQVSVPFAALYVGTLALGLAVFAVIAAARRDPTAPPRSLTFFFADLTLAGLILSFGQMTPVYQLAYLLAPGWRLFRGQERLAMWVVFGVAMLAALGAAALQREMAAQRERDSDAAARTLPDNRKCVARDFWIAAALALLFAAGCFIGYQAGNDGLWGFTAAGIFLSLMFLASGVAVRSGNGALIALVMIVDLFTLNGNQHAGTTATAQPFPPGPALAAVQADTSAFRTANEGMLPEHVGYGYRLEEIDGASPLRLATYDRLLREAPPPLLWRLLGVKYVFTWRQELEAPAERLAEQPGRDGKPVYVYRLADPAPLAWLTGNVAVEPDVNAQVDRVLAPGFDPATQAVLSSKPDPAPSPACGGSVAWTQRLPERLDLTVTTDAPCVLVLSEIAYPGWQAVVDGQPAPILTANGVLRAVPLAAGAHTVRLFFTPRILLTGALISLLAVIATAIALLAARLAEGRFGPDAHRRDLAPTFPA